MFPTTAALLLTLVAHDVSISQSRVEIRDAALQCQLRFQSKSALEALPALDLDQDHQLSSEELDRSRQLLTDYINRHYELLSNDQGSALVGYLREARLVLEREGSPFEERWVEAALDYSAPEAVETLSVRCTLFVESNPNHLDHAQVRWGDEAPREFTFNDENPRFRFESADHRRPGVWKSFYQLGFEHILGGYDHLAFVLVLVLASLSLRSILAVVTAFTLSHSLSLALAAFEVVSLPSRMVEVAIALSIAYVAAENLIHRRPRRLWIEAFLFGLLHGLGFAGALSDSLLGEELQLSALFAFNLGVESGQVGVVLGAVLLLKLLPKQAPAGSGEPNWMAPKWLRLSGSALVTVLGLYWFVQRAWL